MNNKKENIKVPSFNCNQVDNEAETERTVEYVNIPRIALVQKKVERTVKKFI